MNPNFWHVTIGMSMVAALFGATGFIGYALYGPGITITIPNLFGTSESTTTPPIVQETPKEQEILTPSLVEEPGTLFECDAEKALKAEFSERSVRLALSDGRVLTLPQVVSEEGEIRYENADGSFAFRNTGRIVFIEESGKTTYVNCATTGEI